MSKGDNSSRRRLIVTADDFGAADCIDEGILYAVEHGFVTSVGVLSNYPDAAKRVKKLCRTYKSIGWGIHLNISSGRPLSDPEEVPTLVDEEGRFYPVEKLVPRLADVSPEDLETEIEKQILAFKKIALPVDHVSCHCGVLGVYLPFFNKLIGLALKYNIPMRRPIPISVLQPGIFGYSKTRSKGRRIALHLGIKNPLQLFLLYTGSGIRKINKRVAAEKIKTPDAHIDAFYGSPTPENLLYILKNLPAGISEMTFHLGMNVERCSVPYGIDPAYLRQREEELIIASSFFAKELLEYNEIDLAGFKDLR